MNKKQMSFKDSMKLLRKIRYETEHAELANCLGDLVDVFAEYEDKLDEEEDDDASDQDS